MTDRIFESFLATQYEQGMQLAEQSDLLELHARQGDGPPTHYLAQFTCSGVLRAHDGSVAPAETLFAIGIAFPEGYLRHVDPLRVVTWLGPHNVWHPNIAPPVVCVGRIVPGTELVDLLFQVYEEISYYNYSTHDFLNPDAAQWARRHTHLFPVDRRPLKRRALNLQVQRVTEPAPKAAAKNLPADHSIGEDQSGDLVKGDLVKGDLVKGDLVKGDLVKGDLVNKNARVRRKRAASARKTGKKRAGRSGGDVRKKSKKEPEE